MRRRTATAYRLRPGSVEDLANSDGTFVLTATRKGIHGRSGGGDLAAMEGFSDPARPDCGQTTVASEGSFEGDAHA